jgi:hypothetical protein
MYADGNLFLYILHGASYLLRAFLDRAVQTRTVAARNKDCVYNKHTPNSTCFFTTNNLRNRTQEQAGADESGRYIHDPCVRSAFARLQLAQLPG